MPGIKHLASLGFNLEAESRNVAADLNCPLRYHREKKINPNPERTTLLQKGKRQSALGRQPPVSAAPRAQISMPHSQSSHALTLLSQWSARA